MNRRYCVLCAPIITTLGHHATLYCGTGCCRLAQLQSGAKHGFKKIMGLNICSSVQRLLCISRVYLSIQHLHCKCERFDCASHMSGSCRKRASSSSIRGVCKSSILCRQQLLVQCLLGLCFGTQHARVFFAMFHLCVFNRPSSPFIYLLGVPSGAFVSMRTQSICTFIAVFLVHFKWYITTYDELCVSSF